LRYPLIVTVICLAWFGVVELGLRNSDEHILDRTFKGRATNFIKLDPIIGWRSNAGEYYFPPFVPGGEDILVTILDDGGRATKKNVQYLQNSALDTVSFFGCSFTFGHGISDHQTFAWKLQDKHPSLDLKNYATSGYGTYGSLLRLQETLPQIKKPRTIIYGFMQNHEIRNVAPNWWLSNLIIPAPFVSVSADGNLIPLMTKKFKPFPWRHQSAVMLRLEAAYKQFLSPDQSIDPKIMALVTTKLVQEMHALSTRASAEFYMVILDAKTKTTQFYVDKLTSLGINVVDCTHPDFAMINTSATTGYVMNRNLIKAAKLTVPGDGHPNEIMNDYWAECINSKIKL